MNSYSHSSFKRYLNIRLEGNMCRVSAQIIIFPNLVTRFVACSFYSLVATVWNSWIGSFSYCTDSWVQFALCEPKSCNMEGKEDVASKFLESFD